MVQRGAQTVGTEGDIMDTQPKFANGTYVRWNADKRCYYVARSEYRGRHLDAVYWISRQHSEHPLPSGVIIALESQLEKVEHEHPNPRSTRPSPIR